MIFVNFKTYKEATGDNAVKLAIACELVTEQTRVPIIPVVQTLDLWRVKQHVNIPVWIQHVDRYSYGQHSGFTTIEAAIQAEANGTILNHSEHPVTIEILKETVDRVKQLDSTFETLICAPDMGVLTEVNKLAPSYVSYEPPELIGSDTDSVASMKSGVVTEGVKASADTPLVVGAGIKSKEDVITSLRCNAKGILVSKAVIKADKPEDKLHELASAFKSE